MDEAADLPLNIDVERVAKVACHKCGFTVDVADAPPLSVVRCGACRALLRVPAMLGDYMLTEQLGVGSAGATYIARDMHLHRDVAVKVIARSLQGDDAVADSVMREARVLAALNHPNVVHIYTVAEHRGQPFIVMELVRGEPISTLVKRKGPISERRALEMAVAVAEGLRAALDIGLVHGDIKPGNILISEHGHTKVVDFGLARPAAAAQDDKVRGTPNYIAPEKAEGQLADHRADIYSLGCTLYFALTGQRPFEGRTLREVLAARLRQPTPDARVIRRDLSVKTAALIGRMMNRDPRSRPGNYAGLLFELRAVLNDLHSRRAAGAAPSAAAAPREGTPARQVPTPEAPPPPQVNTAALGQDDFVFGSQSHGPSAAGPAAPTTRRQRVRVRRKSLDAAAIIIIAAIVLLGVIVFFISLHATGVLG